MTRLLLALSSIGLAFVAGCASEHRVAPAPAPVVVSPPAATTSSGAAVIVPQASAPAVVVAPAPMPLRAGHGRIEAMVPVPAAAAAGSSVPGADKRLSIRMDDGTMQYLDTAAPNLALGERVQITSDGRMIHPAP
jgi:hypothetical protein